MYMSLPSGCRRGFSMRSAPFSQGEGDGNPLGRRGECHGTKPPLSGGGLAFVHDLLQDLDQVLQAVQRDVPG